MNKSVSRAVDILAYLSQCRRPVGITEISRALDIPKSSASDCLYTLLDKGYVSLEDERLRTFSVGVNTARIGLAVLDQVGYNRLTDTELEHLHRNTGLTVCFYVFSDNGALCLSVAADDGKRKLATGAGDIYELHLSAAGKAMLSLLSDHEVERLVGTGCYAVHTSKSICNHFALMRELELTRKRGWAVEDFENNSFTYALAAPLFYRGGRPAAVALEMSVTELANADSDSLARELCASAKRISGVFDARNSTEVMI